MTFGSSQVVANAPAKLTGWRYCRLPLDVALLPA